MVEAEESHPLVKESPLVFNQTPVWLGLAAHYCEPESSPATADFKMLRERLTYLCLVYILLLLLGVSENLVVIRFFLFLWFPFCM